MATCVSLRVQMASIMEVLTKTALVEMNKLVDDASAALRLEMSRSQREIEALKRTLLVMEGELRAARGCAPDTSLNIALEVKVSDEFGEAQNSKFAGEGSIVAVERGFDERLSAAQGPVKYEEYVPVENKTTVPDALEIKYEPVDEKQDWTEAVSLNEDWLGEAPKTSQSQPDQKIFKETNCGTLRAAAAAIYGGEGPLCDEEGLHMLPYPEGDPEKGLQAELKQEPEGERFDHALPLLGSMDLGLELSSGMVSEEHGWCGRRAQVEASFDASAEPDSGLRIEGREAFICTCCGKTFPDTLELQTHEEQQGTGQRFCSSECSNAFSYSSILEKHQQIHRKEPFTSSGCDETFSQSFWGDPGEEHLEAGGPVGDLSGGDATPPFRTTPPKTDDPTPGLRGRKRLRTDGDGPASQSRRGLYDKRHYCLYCQKGYCKIARHLESVHLSEPEVAGAVRFPKNSKERHLRLHQLRNRGDFAHNSRVARTGTGELVVCRRFGPKRELGDFSYCLYCKGLFSKALLWKHMKNCKLKPKDVRDRVSKFKRVVRWTLPAPSFPDVSEDLQKLVGGMMEDDVFDVMKEDSCILKLGENMLRRLGGDGKRYDYIRHKLRTVAKLLAEVRKRTPLKKLEDLLTPSNFPHVLLAVRSMAGFDEERDRYRTPSLARRLGYGLHGVCSVVEDEALAKGNPDLARSAGDFREMLYKRWAELVPTDAPTPLGEDELAPPLQMRLVRDVKLLNLYLDKKLEGIQNQFREEPTRQSYGGLAKVVLAQVVLFNRCRQGEVSAMPLTAFTSRDVTPVEPPFEDDSISGLERKLCRHFPRLVLSRKGGGKVLVLLKPSVAAAMELLLLHREACEVPPENDRVFGRPGALSCYHSGPAIHQFAEECGAENADAISSVRLRKHVATILNVISLKESGVLVDFLGQDSEASGKPGMLTEAAAGDSVDDDLQLAEMAATLLAEDERMTAELCGVDDDKADPKEPSAENNAEELAEAPVSEVSADKPGTPESPKLSILCPKPGAPKRKWERVEVEAVERHMMRFIGTGKLPGKRDCLRCLQSEPHALQGRNWANVKYYIKNRITASKRLK